MRRVVAHPALSADRLELPRNRIAHACVPRTVSRWNQGTAIQKPDAEQILLELHRRGALGLLRTAGGRLWLFSHQRLLEEQTPAKLIGQGRIDEVRSMVAQLRAGVFV